MADRRMKQGDREGGSGLLFTAATATAPAPAVGGSGGGCAGGGGGGGNSTTHSTGGNSSIKVAVRVRPLTEHECTPGRPSATLVTDSNRGLVAIRSTDGTDQPKVFQFDKVFDQSASQREVFEAVARPVVDKALQGFNGAIIAYGQTGTGKTYTMEGDLMGDDEQMGIIPGVCRHIFEATAGTRSSVHVNYIEIYNEDLRDLLSERRDCIALRELAGGRLILGRDYKVESLDDITHLLQRGKANRAVAVTRNNESSSRSHAVFMLHYASTCAPPSSAGGKGSSSREGNVGGGNAMPGHRGPARVVRSTLQLVDLAGSERLESQARNTEGTRLRESRKINKSLTALGLVISALAERKRHVPYRDSKLTRLLQDSLGGNSHTVLIATVSPAEAHRKETMCTLRYATGAKDVTNVVVRNESEMRLAAAAAAAAAATFDANACVAWPNTLDQFWTPSGGSNGGGGSTHRGNSGRAWGRLARRGASAKGMTRMNRTSGRVGGRASFPTGAADSGVFERWWDSKRARDNGRASNRASAVQASALRIVFTGAGVSSAGEGRTKTGGMRNNGAGGGSNGRRAYTSGRTGGGPCVSKEGRTRDKDKCIESAFSSDLESLPFSVTSISARQLARRSTTSRRTQTCSLYTGLEVPPPNTPQHCCVCLHPPQSAPAGWPPWLRLAPGSHGVARAAKLAVSLPALPLPEDLPHVKWEKSAIGDCSSLEGLESASTNVQGSEHSYLSRSIVYLDGTSESAGCASPAVMTTPLSTPRESRPPSSPPVQSFTHCRLPAFHDVRCSMTCSVHCRRSRRKSNVCRNASRAAEGACVVRQNPDQELDGPGGDVVGDQERLAIASNELQLRRGEGDVGDRAQGDVNLPDINCYHSQDEVEEEETRIMQNCDQCSVEDDGQVSYTQGTVISVVTTHRGSIAGGDIDEREDNSPSPVERIRHRSVSEGAKEDHRARLQDMEAANGANANASCRSGAGLQGGDGDNTRPIEATQRCQSFASFSSTRWTNGGDADNHRPRPPESMRLFSANSRPSMPSQTLSTTSWHITPQHPQFNHIAATGGAHPGSKVNVLGGTSSFTNSHIPTGSGVIAPPPYTAFFPGNGAAGLHSQQLETLDYVKKGVFKGLEDLESEVKCMYRNLNRRCLSMHSRPPTGLCVSNSACEFPSAKERTQNYGATSGAGAKFSSPAVNTAEPSKGQHWWDRSGTEILKTNNYRQTNPRTESNSMQAMDSAAAAGSNPLPVRPSFPSQNPFYPSHPHYFRPLRRSLTQYT